MRGSKAKRLRKDTEGLLGVKDGRPRSYITTARGVIRLHSSEVRSMYKKYKRIVKAIDRGDYELPDEE